MQRSQKRYLCSTASAPSRSTTSLRPRRRSRTSSVAGDSLLVAREVKKAGSDSRAKARSTKVRTAAQKSGRKAPPSLPKNARPSIDVLQNTIVLAPFYTLKRCFQNKLVDLYSLEKMKKINRKMKMIAKQKMSFQYDIVELNQLNAAVKKEAKGPKERQKLRSPSYCQCDRRTDLDFKKSPNSQKVMKPDQLYTSNNTFYVGHSGTKRRRLTPNILKAELSPRLNFCSPNSFLPSDTNFSSSRVSSRSKSDSLETDSNSRSFRDERLTGSLALSATSFDSCLENFEKCPTVARGAPKRYNRPRSTANDVKFHTKPNASRTPAMHIATLNSDTRVDEFMDREPQSQLISHDSSLHLQSLSRRRSKSRAKRPENATTNYFLRSLTPDKVRVEHVEVATQVEGSGSLEEATKECIPVPETASEHKAASLEPGEMCEPVSEEVDPSEGFSEGVTPVVDIGTDIEGPSEPEPFEVLGDLEERFAGGATNLQELQDKESDFIFGNRNTASRLGESCKFSFGLNFVNSDDED